MKESFPFIDRQTKWWRKSGHTKENQIKYLLTPCSIPVGGWGWRVDLDVRIEEKNNNTKNQKNDIYISFAWPILMASRATKSMVGYLPSDWTEKTYERHSLFGLTAEISVLGGILKDHWDLLCGKYIYYIHLCFFLLLLYGLPHHCIDIPTTYWVSKLTHNHALLEHFEWIEWNKVWNTFGSLNGCLQMFVTEKTIWLQYDGIRFATYRYRIHFTQMNHFQKLNKTENLMSKSKPYIELISNATGWFSQDYFKCVNTRAVDSINERYSKL